MSKDSANAGISEARKKAAAALNRPLLRLSPEFLQAEAARQKKIREEVSARLEAEAVAGGDIGYVSSDGWKYCGLSPDTGKPMFVAPEDASQISWHDAVKAAKALEQQVKKDVRLPSKNELDQIFNNKAKIGRFNEIDSIDGDWYWSFTPFDVFGGHARCQRLRGGDQNIVNRDRRLSVRLVRS